MPDLNQPTAATDETDAVSLRQQIKKEKELSRWQTRLVPWMIFLPTALIGVFIVLSTLQMQHIEKFVYQNNLLSLKEKLPDPSTIKVDSVISDKLSYVKFYALANMEEISMNRRYNAAGAGMMSGIYIKYLGFFTGMILAIVGAVFIISKLREDISKLGMSLSEQMKFRVVSSSPGVIFGLLGTVLMIVTIVKKVDFGTKDGSLYLNNAVLHSDDPVNPEINEGAIKSLPGETSHDTNYHINPANLNKALQGK